tara:strand:+ start:327 stop:1283 length:957 start_codon:yes stop_codon:yes gene_type:complete
VKKIIITGGSGFLGSKLSEILSESGYEVLSLGRKKYDQLNPIRKDQLSNVVYVDCDLSSENLESIIKKVGWSNEKIYTLFHLAWGGETGLSDLNSMKQFENLSITLDLFESSQNLKVEKFIFTGTMEELFAEEYINLDYKKDKIYNRHVIYALSKLWTRKSLEIKASNSKTDVIFITNSHIIGPGDDKDSFLQVSLSKMINNQPITMSSGIQLFDVIDVIDCANTYLAVMEGGKRLSSYMAGSGKPQMLKNYILEMQTLFPDYQDLSIDTKKYADVVLSEKLFDTSNVIKDTNFTPKIDFKESLISLKEYIQKNSVKY